METIESKQVDNSKKTRSWRDVYTENNWNDLYTLHINEHRRYNDLIKFLKYRCELHIFESVISQKDVLKMNKLQLVELLYKYKYLSKKLLILVKQRNLTHEYLSFRRDFIKWEQSWYRSQLANLGIHSHNVH